MFDLTDLDFDAVETVDDDLTLANLRTIAGLHLRNAKAGTRSCTPNFCSCYYCYYCGGTCHDQPATPSKD
jgi:hypothetical protein